MMEKYELQKLRDLPIEGVAERLGLHITRDHKSLCPFHDDHRASLSFCVRKNTCRCFVCMNQSLGTIDLVMKHLRLPFRQACQWLANEDLSLTLPKREGTDSNKFKGDKRGPSFDPSRYLRFFEHPTLSPEACRFLYDERRLDPRVIRWCRITSWRDKNGTNWLQTPYYDMDGKLIGVQNRNLDPPLSPPRGEDSAGSSVVLSPISSSPLGGDRGGSAPRFRFPRGSRCSIYNLPVLRMLRPGDELWITEGCSDCWAMLSSGRKAIAIPSATLLSPQDKQLLASLSTPPPLGGTERGRGLTFHMYPDNDLPGERLFLQLREVLPTLQHHPLPADCKDFSEYYVRASASPSPSLTTRQPPPHDVSSRP